MIDGAKLTEMDLDDLTEIATASLPQRGETPANEGVMALLAIKAVAEVRRLREENKLRHATFRCDEHKPDPDHAWGCPDCLMFLRNEIAHLRNLAKDPRAVEAASAAHWDESEPIKWSEEPEAHWKDTFREEMQVALRAAAEAIK